jgi:hypothetical protein
MSDLAGSIPPITSTTTSMSPRVTRPIASVVKRSAGMSTSRGRSIRRTATPTSSTGAPTRATRSPACSESNLATSDPTTPQPRSATRIGRVIGSPSRRTSCRVELVVDV